MIKLAYLGPEGTYSEEAALAHARFETQTREGLPRAVQAAAHPGASARLAKMIWIPSDQMGSRRTKGSVGQPGNRATPSSR